LIVIRTKSHDLGNVGIVYGSERSNPAVTKLIIVVNFPTLKEGRNISEIHASTNYFT
jgi:hypothetical protein